MKALFGVVSLLVALAIVGWLGVKQLAASKRTVSDVSASAGSQAASALVNGNVRQQSQQIQDRVSTDITKALEQGAAARQEAADK